MKSSVKRHLVVNVCSGCGACIGICPVNAIVPVDIKGYAGLSIDTGKCVKCGLCVKACPMIKSVEDSSTTTIVSRENSIVRAFLTYATDLNIRYRGASGGVVTALLIYLLKKKEIDGALVVKMDKTKPFPLIAKTAEEILKAQGSIYFPTFSLSILKKLKAMEGKYAVVGLPCQIDAIKKLIDIGWLPRDRITYLFGLQCHGIFAPWYLDYVLKNLLKLSKDEVYEITARRYGWPGKIFVLSKHGVYVVHLFDETISVWNPLSSSNLNAQLPCIICTNHSNVNADITFGDAWMPEVVGREKIGVSLIIARTKRGSELLERAVRDGVIRVEEIQTNLASSESIFNYDKELLTTLMNNGIIGVASKYGLRGLLVVVARLLFYRESSRRVLLALLPPKALFYILYARKNLLHKAINKL
jgi:coenzyme F420 hydrogenase subunit beta